MSARKSPTPSAKPAPRAPVAKSPSRRRVISRVEPFSAWQKLVTSRMQELGLTTRALAKAISTPSWRPEHTTVWAWTKCKDGYPPKDAYSADANLRMAKALELAPEQLAAAYEESRRHLILSRDAPQRGPLSVLRTLFFESTRKTWTKQEIVKLIDEVQGQ